MPTPAEEKALRLQKKKEQLKLSEIANKEKGEQLAEQGFAPNEQVSRARRRRRKEAGAFEHPESLRKKRKKESATNSSFQQEGENENNVAKKVHNIDGAYDHVERRDLIGDEPNELPLLGGVYSSEMLKYSDPSGLDILELDYDEVHRKSKILRLPEDGSIFIDGLPFHHLVLTNLNPRHIRRLRLNGIQISSKHFSRSEDRRIRKNWREYATLNGLDEGEAEWYVSAATTRESKSDQAERIKFIRETNFRPFLCKRLLNRTCVQVFRRSYYLFHSENDGENIEREWTEEEDQKLLDFIEENGQKFERAGGLLNRTRFSCHRRYNFLKGHPPPLHGHSSSSGPHVPSAWNDVEISRLYKYLCDHCRHPPVVIALNSERYHRDLAKINWVDPKMRLAHRSTAAKQAAWENLAEKFREASARLETNLIRELEDDVLPTDHRTLFFARVFKSNLKIQPKTVSKCAGILAAESADIQSLRSIDRVRFLHSLKESGVLEEIRGLQHDVESGQEENGGGSQLDRPEPILRRIRWAELLCNTHFCFQRLPIEHDGLQVRLELIAYVLKKMARYKIQKRKLWKRVVRFIRGRGWEPRKVAILVDGARNAKKKKRGSEKAIQNDLTIEIADQEEEAQSLPNGLSQKTKNKKNKKLFDAEASATDLIDLPLPPDETIEEELQHNGDLNGSLLDDPVEMKKKKRRAKKESTDSAGGLK